LKFLPIPKAICTHVAPSGGTLAATVAAASRSHPSQKQKKQEQLAKKHKSKKAKKARAAWQEQLAEQEDTCVW